MEVELCHSLPRGVCCRFCGKFPIHAGARDDAIRFRPCWLPLFVPCFAAREATRRSLIGFTPKRWKSGICLGFGDARRNWGPSVRF